MVKKGLERFVCVFVREREGETEGGREEWDGGYSGCEVRRYRQGLEPRGTCM